MPKSGRTQRAASGSFATMPVTYTGEGKMDSITMIDTIQKLKAMDIQVPAGLTIEFVKVNVIRRPNAYIKDRDGEYDIASKTIRIASNYRDSLDIAFTLAHELGHVDHITRDLAGFKKATFVEREVYANEIARRATGIKVAPAWYKNYKALDAQRGK